MSKNKKESASVNKIVYKEPPPAPLNESPPALTNESPPAPTNESPTEQILEFAFRQWVSSFTCPMTYFMTRTFAHQRLGEKYDTSLIFNQLQQISGGNHERFMKEIETFHDVLIKELKTYLAAKDDTR